MRNKLKAPVSLRDILPKALKMQGLGGRAELHLLTEKWPALVGEALARRSHPLKITGKRLFIGVEGASWANEMDYLKTALMEKIREELPAVAIDEIRLQIVTRSAAST